MKKVLLIGSTGLVGSRVKELLDKKFQLITPDEDELNLLDKNNLDYFYKKIENISAKEVLIRRKT